MNKAKKIIYIVITVLEAVLLTGAYVINHLTIKKLGVTRWMNFHGIQWEENYPVFLIKAGAIAVLVLFLVLEVWLYLKRRKQLKWYVGLSVMAACIMVLIAVGYILLSSFAKKRAYYVICIVLVMAALLQAVKALAGSSKRSR